MVDATEHFLGVIVIDENMVPCSITRDEDANDYSVEQFEPWYYSTWQEAWLLRTKHSQPCCNIDYDKCSITSKSEHG